MQRLGGKEQLLAQVYSAIATRRDDTVELALRAYGAPPLLWVAARASSRLNCGWLRSRRCCERRCG